MKKTKESKNNTRSNQENTTTIQVIEVSTQKDLKKFVRFQNWLYKDNKFYVPALELDELRLFSPKNPSWDEVELKAFLAIRHSDNKSKGTIKLRGDEIVGRIAVMVHKTYNKLHSCKYARFTRFDVIDDNKIAQALIDTACNFARERGMEVIHGPLGFNDMDKEGLLVEGFDRLGTFANFYNYAYYKKHLEDAGFEKEVDWLEFLIPMPRVPDTSKSTTNVTPSTPDASKSADDIAPTGLDARMIKIAERQLSKLELQVVPAKMPKSKLLKNYGKEIFSVINESYAGLHGVIPITDGVRDGILKQFKTIIKREHVCIVLDKSGKVVGFGLTAPNISRSLNASKGRYCKFGFLPINALRIIMEARNPKYVDMCLVAVVPEYRGKGVNAIIMYEMFKTLVKTKVKSLETNLQMETNTAVQSQFDGFGKQLIKKRRCYKKILTPIIPTAENN